MPAPSLKGLMDKSNKSMAELEKLWYKAKEVVTKEYPDVSKDDDKYYQLVMGVVKKMAGIKESFTFTDRVQEEMEKLNRLSETEEEKKKMKKTDDDEEVDEEDEEVDGEKKKMKKTDDDEEEEDEDKKEM